MKAVLMSLIVLSAAISVRAASLYRSDDPLSRAHSAFIAGDTLTTLVELRNTLMEQPYDPVVKENALKLYKEVLAKSGSQGLPADWKIPNGLNSMKIAVQHVMNVHDQYRLHVSGAMNEAGLVDELQVVRYPDQVVMDKAAGIGTYDESTTANGTHEYSLKSVKTNEPTKTGLYLLKCVLKSGEKVDGWFIVDDQMNSTATPDVMTPAMDEVFANGKPTLRWKNFQSPQYKPSETRALWMGISRTDLGQNWALRWEKWLRSPSLEQLTVGVTEPTSGVAELEDGRYVFAINYHEITKFGSALLYRDSVTYRPFAVKQSR
jgi:hypothetical protein